MGRVHEQIIAEKKQSEAADPVKTRGQRARLDRPENDRSAHKLDPLAMRNDLVARSEHHAEASSATHHALIGLFGFFQGVGLNHGANAGEGAEVERVF